MLRLQADFLQVDRLSQRVIEKRGGHDRAGTLEGGCRSWLNVAAVEMVNQRPIHPISGATSPAESLPPLSFEWVLYAMASWAIVSAPNMAIEAGR
jgi:hypothetical protein